MTKNMAAAIAFVEVLNAELLSIAGRIIAREMGG